MNIYVYILIMGAVSYAVRVLPMTVLRKPIRSRFVKSFLYYVPYVTLAVMTFPAIINAAQTPYSGMAALIVGVAAAALGADLFKTAACCCATVFVLELFLV